MIVQNSIKGADLVICQHNHCSVCFEKYEDSTIIYEQGNCILNHSDSEYWQTNLLIKLKIKVVLNIEYIPIIKKCYTFSRKESRGRNISSIP